MDTRELVILLLGLGIIAVVLRGLYVAIQGRRGQIRLAISKNIPENVNLDALEMSELPSGGARIVNRSLQQVNLQNSALNTAKAKAEALDLGEDTDSQIPVLMDAVEVVEPMPDQYDDAAEVQLEEDVGSHDVDGLTEVEVGEKELVSESLYEELAVNYKRIEVDEQEFDGAFTDGDPGFDPDPDAVLFDYEDVTESDMAASDTDPLQAVAPDYEEDYEELEEEGSEEAVWDSDEFSMTAGERIGINKPLAGKAEQSGLFDDVDDEPESKPKRKSIFSVFGRRSKPEKNTAAEDDIEDFEPPTVVSEASPEFAEEELGDETEQDISAAEPELDAGLDQGSQQDSIELSEVIVINIMAKEGRVFAGNDLLHVLISLGLKFGDMNIFHKRLGDDRQGAILFSVANVLNPGSFDLNNMEELTTLGLSLFLALPTPVNNLDAFEQMLSVAQQIRGALDGELKDDHRNGMTAQTTEHYRQRIRDFELRRLKTVGARG